MKITRTKLEGVIIIEPDVFGDNRGLKVRCVVYIFKKVIKHRQSLCAA